MSRSSPPIILAPSLFGPSNAAVIHRFGLRRRLRVRTWGSRVGLVFELALWYLIALFNAERLSRHHGAVIQQRTGKSPGRQRWEQRFLALFHTVPPKSYYHFRLYEPEQRARVGEFLHRSETKKRGVFGRLNPKGSGRNALNDKRLFTETCRKLGVSVVPNLLELWAGDVLPLDHLEPTLPEIDLIVKPTRGRGGIGVSRWEAVGGGRFRGLDGECLDGRQLLERLLELSRDRAHLVQPRLLNHHELRDLGGGVLTTVRVLSCLDEHGRAEVTNASFRIAVDDAVVDNMHRGGVAAAVDLDTGRLGRGIAMDAASDWLEKHPRSGAPIAGRFLPHWQEALELVRRAHDGIPRILLAGWDVAFLEEGPCLIEGNSAPCVNLIQRPLGGPIGSGRFGELLAHHITRVRRGAGARVPGRP